MKKAITLVIISIALTLAALVLYRWLVGYVFAAELGWLQFFTR